MSQAFSLLPAPVRPEVTRPITAPPTSSLEPPETETGGTAMATASSTGNTNLLEFLHNKCYSYGVLEKKWSL